MSDAPAAVNDSRVTVESEPLFCPMCDYDLRGQRGQAEPRCPECGYRFEWEELTDPARRLHPYLFEHHPKRNIRSFFRTLIGGWRPRRFWTTLHPGQPSRPRRLTAYLIVTCITCVLAGLILPTATWTIRYDHVLDVRAFIIARINAGTLRVPPGITAQQFAVQSAPAPTIKDVFTGTLGDELAAAAVLIGIAWPVWLALTVGGLMVFQISLLRARVRSVHALRCIVYSADVMIWANCFYALAGAAFVVHATMQAGRAGLGLNFLETFVIAWTTLAVTAELIFIYRLIVAVKRYLRFDHAIATVMATQIIAFLAGLSIVVYTVPM